MRVVTPVIKPASSIGLVARVRERLRRLFNGGGWGAPFSMRIPECYEPI